MRAMVEQPPVNEDEVDDRVDAGEAPKGPPRWSDKEWTQMEVECDQLLVEWDHIR